MSCTTGSTHGSNRTPRTGRETEFLLSRSPPARARATSSPARFHPLFSRCDTLSLQLRSIGKSLHARSFIMDSAPAKGAMGPQERALREDLDAVKQDLGKL